MTRTVKVLGSFALLALVGCEFHARSPEQYRDDTQALIQSSAPAMEKCYTDALAQDQSLAGQVTVTFMVEPETGRLTNPAVDPTSTAPAALGQCVVGVLGGLALAPADEREGQATWVFDFQPRPATVTAAPAEAESAQPAAAAPMAAEPAAAQAATMTPATTTAAPAAAQTATATPVAAAPAPAAAKPAPAAPAAKPAPAVPATATATTPK